MSGYPTMSPACEMPPPNRATTEERQHPLFSEYQRYEQRLRAQLVEAPPFSSWLRQREAAEPVMLEDMFGPGADEHVADGHCGRSECVLCRRVWGEA